MQRTIKELINLQTGQHHYSDEILSNSEKNIMELRRELAINAKQHKMDVDNAVSLSCAICTQPVRLVGTPKHEYYFKHDNSSGDCPIKTGGKYSQKDIDTIRYNGAKESKLHMQIKNHLADTLNQDIRFTKIKKEKTVKSNGLFKTWKRPDVSATFNKDLNIVFEIQLSTTFLNVIIDREEFYKDEKIYIMWVFNGFSKDGNRFTEKDIYYANKCNAFVITDDTRCLSEERNELVLICHYKKPYISDHGIAYQWINQEVTITDLKFDSVNYKIYYYDFDNEEEKLKIELKNVNEWNGFEKYWLERNELPAKIKWGMEQAWYDKFKRKGLIPDESMSSMGFPEEIKQVFKALYSIKHKQMINYKYNPNAWLQVSNLILNSRKEFAGIFCKGLKVFGLFDDVLTSDKNHTFARKYKIILDEVKNKNPEYEQNLSFRLLLKALFPELY